MALTCLAPLSVARSSAVEVPPRTWSVTACHRSKLPAGSAPQERRVLQEGAAQQTGREGAPHDHSDQ